MSVCTGRKTSTLKLQLDPAQRKFNELMFEFFLEGSVLTKPNVASTETIKKSFVPRPSGHI